MQNVDKIDKKDKKIFEKKNKGVDKIDEKKTKKCLKKE